MAEADGRVVQDILVAVAARAQRRRDARVGEEARAWGQLLQRRPALRWLFQRRQRRRLVAGDEGDARHARQAGEDARDPDRR